MTTMQWFGHKYDAPAWDEALEEPVPVGTPCGGCHRPFTPDEDGISHPSGTQPRKRHPFHVECFFRHVLGLDAPLPRRIESHG